jgi:hypothetical protein
MASKSESKKVARKAGKDVRNTTKDNTKAVDSDEDVESSPPVGGGENWIWFFKLGAKRLEKCQSLHQNTCSDYNLFVSTLAPDQTIDTGIAASIRCILLREYGNKKDLRDGQGLPTAKRKAYLSVIDEEMKIYDTALAKAEARGKGKKAKKGLSALRQAFEKQYPVKN